MSRIALIAALEQELAPLVRGWAPGRLQAGGKSLPCFESGPGIAVAGGVGCRRAELAARAAVERFQPQTLVSIGFAGALIRSLKVGSIVAPNVIVDAATGAEYRCQVGGDVVGGGVLVSASEIAGANSKPKLAERFHALVVDMEAAGVAKAAQEFNLGFRCVKAISDEYDFVMPPLGRFVNGEGEFRTAAFVKWIALRPQHWPATVLLARNGNRAARSLSDWLSKNLAGNFPQGTVVTLKEAEHFRD